MESKEDKINKALGVDFQWVVADRVIAAWEDQSQARHNHYLGRLSSHNKKAEFSLMLGHLPEEKNDFLLLFHLPLRVHAGSASKPIDLFVAFPVESFDSTYPLGLGVDAAKIPQPHVDAIKSAGLDNPQNVMHVHFNLKEPGYVMMPRMKIKNPLVGTPRELLLNLRSLSRALSFDVYLKRNTYSQVALASFSSAVLQGVAHNPGLRLKSMYRGRGAKQGAWDLFGLADDDTPLKAGNPLAAKALESDREDGIPPPPYEEAVQTPTPSPEKPQQEAAANNLEGQGEEEEEENVEEPRVPDVLVRDSTSVAEEEHATEPHTPNVLIRESVYKTPEPHTPNAPVRDSTSFVSETPPAAPAPAPRRPTTPQIPQKRPFATASSPTASDTEAEVARTRVPKLPLPQLPLLASPSAFFPGSPPLLEPPHTSPPPHHHQQPPRTTRSTPPQPEHLPPSILQRELATWLQDAWTIDALTHHKLLLPLLATGYHARRGDVAAFDLAKGRCTAALYVRLAAAADTTPSSPEEGHVDTEEDMAHLVAWANGAVFRGAESVLRDETKRLGRVAARGWGGEYVRARALWVAGVFVCFGVGRDVDAGVVVMG